MAWIERNLWAVHVTDLNGKSFDNQELLVLAADSREAAKKARAFAEEKFGKPARVKEAKLEGTIDVF